MRLIGAFLTLCIALAVLKVAVTFVALAILGALFVSAIVKPTETAGCLLLLALLGAIGQYPRSGLLIVGGLVLSGWILKRRNSG